MKATFLKFTISVRLMFAGWLLLILVPILSSRAQLKFSGFGRTVMESQTLTGGILLNDSLSDRKTAAGYSLVDLKPKYAYKDKLEVFADVRLKNTLGGFGGVGLSLNIRQFTIQGKAGRFLRYELGDFDVKLSPLTFWSQSDSDLLPESQVFSFRRNILHYENFAIDHQWRMRGARLRSVVPLKGENNQLSVTLFGTSDRTAVSFSNPMHLGGNLVLEKKEKLRLEGTALLHDQLANNPGKNQVQLYSTRGWFQYRRADLGIAVEAELAQSESARAQAGSDRLKRLSDYSWDGKAEVFHTRWNLKLWGEVQETGPSFCSPGSQTLRITGTRPSGFFPLIRNNSQFRSQGILDRIGSENIQNQTISFYRQDYLPTFGLILPYGKATPNRQGFTCGLSRYKEESIVHFSAQWLQYQEITGEGNVARRSFSGQVLSGGLRLDKWLLSRRKTGLTAGYRNETSERKGDLPTDFKVRMVEVGATWEVVSNLEVLAGFRSIQAVGNEVVSQINTSNEISGYSPFSLDQTQSLLGTGLRFCFSPRCFFVVSGYFDRQKADAFSSWNLNQFYSNFSYEF